MYGIQFCLFIFYSSAFSSTDFNYSKSWLNHCKTCYKETCWSPAAQAFCEYNSEAASVLESDDIEEDGTKNSLINTEVDEKLFDFMENVPFLMYNDCLPLISQYTDCSKENICIGCRQCSCSLQGSWTCNLVQKCRPLRRAAIDHQGLTTAVEKLKYEETVSRYKRSLLNTTSNIEPFWKIIASFHNDNKKEIDLTDEDIQLAEVSTKDDKEVKATDEPVSANQTDNDAFKIDNENLAFKEVLNNIAIQIKTRRKPILDERIIDNLTHNDVNNSLFDYVNILDAFIDNNSSYTNEVVESVTEVIVDLLASVTNRNGNWLDEKTFSKEIMLGQKAETSSSKSQLDSFFENKENVSSITVDEQLDKSKSYEIDNTVNRVFKREVANFTIGKVHSTKNETKTTLKPTTETNIKTNTAEIKKEIFEPLNNLIREKQKEIEDLTFVKEKISKYLMSIKDTHNNSRILNSNDTVNEVKSHFSLYKVEINPQPKNYNSRLYENNHFNKYLQKIRKDIYNTIVDVEVLKKLSHNHFSTDLENVEVALKNYALKEGIYKNDIYLSRRAPISNEAKEIVDFMIEILKLADKGKAENKSTSSGANKIIGRILNQNLLQGTVDLYRTDHNTNLAEKLQDIGKTWEGLTNKIVKSSPNEMLQNMKLAHFSLSKDVLKLADTLLLLNFARTRRMSIIDNVVGEKLLSEIKHSFNKVSSTIRGTLFDRNTVRERESQKNIRPTFLKRLKNIYHRSKNSFLRLIKVKNDDRKLFKATKTNNIKKDEDNTEKHLIYYENRFQNLANHKNRNKRSAIHHNKHQEQTKNILPKYLRGKIIAAKKTIKSKKKGKSRKNRKTKTAKNKNKIVSNITTINKPRRNSTLRSSLR